MQKPVKPVAYALGLLALAHPAIVPPALHALAVAAGLGAAAVLWVLAHLALTLTVAAGVLLAQFLPGRLGAVARWFGRAWDTSIDAVLPRTI
ncbi:hypothetical protein ABZV65_30755 [Streptomyces bauhiniae]|uniref:hypothetical protein n=1 Tax=Streptomyces bauhiniae TaxID=2340725 RepID=UPI0033A274E7